MKILIFIVAVALATLILVVKAIHTAAMFMGEQEKVRRNDIYDNQRVPKGSYEKYQPGITE